MSVDKVSRLPNSPVDSLGPRSGGAHPTPPNLAHPGGAQFVATSAAIARPGAAQAALNAISFDNLSLPLPASATLDNDVARATKSAADAVSTTYARESAQNAAIARLVGGRLPADTIMREVAAALRENAAERGEPPRRFVEDAAVVEDARLPSRNSDDARFTMLTSLRALDEQGEAKTFDLYVTRTGARQWEAVVYQRDEAPPGFPYAAAPISVDRVVIDPATAQILACVASQILPREPTNGTVQAPTVNLGNVIRMVLVALAAIGAAIVFDKTVALVVAISLLAGAFARRDPK
jgi:hypothetical protein